MLDEDDAIARKQTEEDVRLFGSRPEPQDPDEYCEAMEVDSSEKSRKRPASEPFDDGEVGRAKIRRDGSAALQVDNDRVQCRPVEQRLSAIDWNYGKNPLDAWLAQSALPSPSPLREQEHQAQVLLDQEMQTEEKEVEFFRKVHISMDPLLPGLESTDIAEVNEEENLEFEAQIYFRNITDKFPSMARYLACRLARANVRRVERLEREKKDAESRAILRNPKFATSQAQQPSPILPPDALVPVSNASVVLEGKRAKTMPVSTLFFQSWESAPPNPEPKSFWTGQSTSRSAGSVHSRRSRHSSMNSSLRGEPKYDPQEQNPVFTASPRGSVHYESFQAAPGLPPPPVDLQKLKTFDCDICGNTITVESRRSWQ
jgi:hypothetical protein